MTKFYLAGMDSLRHASPITPEEVLNLLPGLFWDHDCVMLPGLGGFVCNPRSAWYDEAKRQIVPPSRDVLFNPRLTTNDGIVANELMEKRGVMYPEALQAVESLVEHIQNQLDAGNSVELPGLGKLYREEDRQLRFMADAEFERMLQSFGHASIPLVVRDLGATSLVQEAPVLDVAASETGGLNRELSKKEDTQVIPFRLQLARAAAAVAIPLTLAGAYLLADPAGNTTLLGSNPLWNAVPIKSTYAPLERDAGVESMAESLIDNRGESIQDFVTRTSWEGLLEFDVEEGRPAAGGVRVFVPANTAEEERETEPHATSMPVTDLAPKPVVSPTAEPVKFMIVGGAFGVLDNAEKLAASMRKEGFDTSLHHQEHNGLTAVSMGRYASEKLAREALADVRARGHEKAWLKRL